MSTTARWLLVFSGIAFAACGGGDAGPASLLFGAPGPIAGEAGRGSFTFGVSTAAMQIEEDQPESDWEYFTRPVADGGLGRFTYVGDAVRGLSQATTDLALIEEMNLDAYRFNPSWPRIQPTRTGGYVESALLHYDALLDSLHDRGIKPVVTIHHFSSPIWVDDFRDAGGACVPSDTDLCGWDDDAGAALIRDEMAAYAGMLAARWGHRVDEWGTLNEPVNYLVASYGAAQFPPGEFLLFADNGAGLVRAIRNYVLAHVAMYDAIKQYDTVDADGDGNAALVGLSLNNLEWTPTRDNEMSTDPVDLAAAQKIEYAYHFLFPDALRTGGLDLDLDGTAEQTIPGISAANPKLDWLGVQYYARVGVTGKLQLNSTFTFTPCLAPLATNACFSLEDPTHCIPTMGYEYYAEGLYNTLVEYHERYDDLPLTVTESGLATEEGIRRSEHIVRSLEQIVRARDAGVDVRGYYHWSLMDNFEWLYGYDPHFGLYRVDRDQPGYPRTATAGAVTLGQIAGSRRISGAMRSTFGGIGPMTPEPDPNFVYDHTTCMRNP